MNVETAIPAWLRDELSRLTPDFFGKVVLVFEHGRVVRIEKSESIVPQLATIRTGGPTR